MLSQVFTGVPCTEHSGKSLAAERRCFICVRSYVVRKIKYDVVCFQTYAEAFVESLLPFVLT